VLNQNVQRDHVKTGSAPAFERGDDKGGGCVARELPQGPLPRQIPQRSPILTRYSETATAKLSRDFLFIMR